MGLSALAATLVGDLRSEADLRDVADRLAFRFVIWISFGFAASSAATTEGSANSTALLPRRSQYILDNLIARSGRS